MNGCSNVIGLAAVAGGVLGYMKAEREHPRDGAKQVQYTLTGGLLGVGGGIAVGVLLVIILWLLSLLLGAVGMGIGMGQQAMPAMY